MTSVIVAWFIYKHRFFLILVYFDKVIYFVNITFNLILILVIILSLICSISNFIFKKHLISFLSDKNEFTKIQRKGLFLYDFYFPNKKPGMFSIFSNQKYKALNVSNNYTTDSLYTTGQSKFIFK